MKYLIVAIVGSMVGLAMAGGLEKQFAQLPNDAIKEESKSEQSSESKKARPENLIKTINSFIERKNMLGAAELLKQLASHGKEYYQFIYDTFKKMFRSVHPKNYVATGLLEVFSMMGSHEFVDYNKWVIENPNTDKQEKSAALHGLISSGKEIKLFLFEQFKKQTDTTLRLMLLDHLSIASGIQEYKNSFIEFAKDFSQDHLLRKKIILEYRNDNSPEVQNLLNFLKTDETDEEIKKIVNIISEIKSNKDKGFVALKSGELLREKDIIIKIGEIEIDSKEKINKAMFSVTSGPTNAKPQEDIAVTIKRNGTITIINIPRTKLKEEVKAIDGVYIE